MDSPSRISTPAAVHEYCFSSRLGVFRACLLSAIHQPTIPHLILSVVAHTDHQRICTHIPGCPHIPLPLPITCQGYLVHLLVCTLFECLVVLVQVAISLLHVYRVAADINSLSSDISTTLPPKGMAKVCASPILKSVSRQATGSSHLYPSTTTSPLVVAMHSYWYLLNFLLNFCLYMSFQCFLFSFLIVCNCINLFLWLCKCNF